MSVASDCQGVRTDMSDLRRTEQLTDAEATLVYAVEVLATAVDSLARYVASLDSRTERLA